MLQINYNRKETETQSKVIHSTKYNVKTKSILPNQKVVFFDCYQTLVGTCIDKEKQKANKQKGWEKFVSLLNHNHGTNIATSDFISLVNQQEANFYAKKDKAIYHHNLLSIISAVLKNNFNLTLPNEEISALVYEYRKISRGYLELYPKVVETLAQLAQEYPLAIVSYTQGCFTQLELKELDLEKYFSYFIYSSDLGLRKESSEFYQKCLQIVEKSPADCIMIGDNCQGDVLIPSQLGINTIWVNNPETCCHQHPDLPTVEATATINLKEFNKLPQIINKIFK